jgi:outer membrane immunogenic protein
MKILLRAAAAVLLAGALSSPALARPHHHLPPPITTIHFHGGSVGFIVGVGGASGFVRFHGVRYPIEVSGLKVGTIGINSYDVDGRVFNLRRLEDIEGSYGAGEASATAGAGAGSIDMTNSNGVEIRATSTSSGLQLTLGPGGATITLKH